MSEASAALQTEDDRRPVDIDRPAKILGLKNEA